MRHPGLGQALSYLYPRAHPLHDFRVEDSGDGHGPTLISWNEATLGPRPTVAAVEAAARAWPEALAARQLLSKLEQLFTPAEFFQAYFESQLGRPAKMNGLLERYQGISPDSESEINPRSSPVARNS